jgi:hypothetical protein
MEYKYNLAKLQYEKKKWNSFHMYVKNRSIGFSKKLEKSFEYAYWANTSQYYSIFLVGVFTYIIFMLLTIPGDYMVIEKQYFKQILFDVF